MNSANAVTNGLDRRQASFRTITRVISLILLVPVVMLIALVIMTPLTVSGLLYVVGTLAVVVGIESVSWGFAKFRRALWLGLGLIIIVAVVRVFLLRGRNSISMITLPGRTPLCLINCIFDEQDVSLVSTRVLSLIGWISADEQIGLMDAMYAGYHGMANEQPLTPSPFVRTYLKLEHPNAFDAVVIEPDTQQPIQMGIIFLHGFAGNFTMPCWLIAQTVRARQGLTVCPSVGWNGDWWSADGEATLRETIDYLHQRGVNRIYLAGLSNGAVGISELAYKLTSEAAGLILISGASVDAKNSNLPVLVLAGHNDERMPADMLKAYANQMESKATFIEIQGDHFMLAKNYAEIRDHINAWLQQH